MTRYTYDYEAGKVVAYECESAASRTADGRTQYVNTHFDTWQEAKDKLLAELRAGISLDSRERQRLLGVVRQLEVQVADQTARLLEAEKLSEP